MKKIFLALASLIVPLLGYSQNYGHHIKYTIELVDGSSVQGYTYVHYNRRDKDTISSYGEYLEKDYEYALRNDFDARGELLYYSKNRIEYHYTNYDGQQLSIFYLTNADSVLNSQIDAIHTDEMTPHTSDIWISTSHTWDDRGWMSSEPVESYSFEGYFCFHQIYIHQKTPETDSIIEELRKITEANLKERERLEEELPYADGEPHYQMQDRIEELEYEIDGQINELLRLFKGQKVVVVSWCTC